MSNVHVLIQAGPLSNPLPPFSADGAGAVVCFEGRIRPSEGAKVIRGLCYEVYEPMARDVLAAIGEETVRRYGLRGLCVEHSKGPVLVGDCCFRLQITALHRQEALEACGQFIDRLKIEAPIWKTPIE